MQNYEKDIDFEKFKQQIERICHFITHHRELFENNEEQVKTSLVLPLLRIIGWDDSNPLEVSFEARTSDGGRIDILLIGGNNSKSLIEVKNLSKNLKDYIDQFGRYAFNRGIPYGALTNGKQWIFLESFKENVPIEKRIIAETDLCEDNLLKLYTILSCLTKTKIGEFEKCIKNNFTNICIQIKNLKGKITKTFKCDNEICNILLSFCENFFSTLEKNFNCIGQQEVEDKMSTIFAGNVQHTSNAFKVIVGNLSIEANIRPNLIKKILEEALNKNWLSEEDFPILNKRGNPIIDLKPILGKNVRFFEIDTRTYYVRGNNPNNYKSVIKALLKKIKEKTGINYEVIKI